MKIINQQYNLSIIKGILKVKIELVLNFGKRKISYQKLTFLRELL